MDNSCFVKELQFGAGDGYLHYYLYNWKGVSRMRFQRLSPKDGPILMYLISSRCAVHQIRGGVFGEPSPEPDASQPTTSGTKTIEAPSVGSGVGVVML
jgi:glycylpeptide N-tetradecanoyltransferase